MTSAAIEDKIAADTSLASGTWTATLNGGTSNPGSKVTATGHYARMGGMVHVQVDFDNVDTSNYAGTVFISGLPVAAKSGTDGLGVVHNNNMISGANDSVQALVPATGSVIRFIENSSDNLLEFGTVGTGKHFSIAVTYLV